MAKSSNKEAVVVFSSVFNLSGVETTLMRILRWLKSQNLHGILVLPDAVEIHSSWQADFANGTLIVIRSKSSPLAKGNRFIEVCRALAPFHRVQSLSICLNSFHDSLVVESLIGSQKMRSFFYYLAGESGRCTQPRSLAAMILKMPGNAFMKNLVVNRRIIFMDEYTQTMCIRDYHLRNLPSEMLLLRLPMDVPEFVSDSEKIRFDQKPRQILTVTRMDFPMKSYVFGLIDSFAKLCLTHENLKLVLVGNGENTDRLEQKLNSLPFGVSSKIQWNPTVPYDELERFFKVAYVFVGMGTTVIDAASRGIPTIPVYPLQEGDACLDFFHLHPILSAHYDEAKEPLYMHDQIDMVLKLDKGEYEYVSRSSNSETQRHYGMARFMNEFMAFEPKKSITLRILSKIWRFRSSMRQK